MTVIPASAILSVMTSQVFNSTVVNNRSARARTRFFLLFCLFHALLRGADACAQSVPSQDVSVSVMDKKSADLAPGFLGLSTRSSQLLSTNGHYYFDANDQALVNTFKTLGIRNLRLGGNAVDYPHVPIPDEKDIDALFNFARAANIKVIYSFRLKNGNPANSARLASCIQSRHADLLDSFSIGNEPDRYLEQYDEFYAAWKPHYDAILKAVPQAVISGPSVCAKRHYAKSLAKDLFADGHLSMVSAHYYFFDDGRKAQRKSAATRARFLSNSTLDTYEHAYANTAAGLADLKVPFRIDEMNSCSYGGAKDASDTYAATLWALDCTHWWAAHNIVGMNYHTAEDLDYAVFLHRADGAGIEMRPIAYAFLAFTHGARGHPAEAKMETKAGFDFTAYAYRKADGSYRLTLINKSYGDNAQTASVVVKLPPESGSGTWQQLDLAQKDQDVAAKTGLTLGGAPVDAQGNWSGRWEKLPGESNQLSVQVPCASASVLQFAPGKGGAAPSSHETSQ